LTLLHYSSLGTVGVALDPSCLLGVRRADSWWFVCRNHQNPLPDGTLVIGADADSDLLKHTDV
jgi:hypothetical protein